MNRGRPALPNGPILVAGIAAAGESVLRLLTSARDSGAVLAWDARDDATLRARAARWRARGVKVFLGGGGTDALAAAGPSVTIVKSPGIAFDVPLLRVAAAQRIEVLDELEIGWRAIRTPVIAVTGTNGKSTTCAIIAAILRAAGRDVQLVGNTEFGPPLTGARPNALAVCEVSSFQLEAAPSFQPEAAIFTNLTLEHLSRHATMDVYGDIKQRMFTYQGRTCDLAVINADDERGRVILTALREAGGRAVSYGFSPSADVQLLDTHWELNEACLRIRAGTSILELRSRMPGRHNAMNIAAAFAYSMAAGIDQATIVAGIEAAEAPPGRCERIDQGQHFDVIIDYAHTPDGIMQILSALRAVVGRRGTALLTVFGAVGLPEPAKAKACGEMAALLSDRLILTLGLAGPSARLQRLQELRIATRGLGHVEIVLERRRAIERAFASAGSGDIVAVLGLGALDVTIPDATGALRSCDDRAIARDILQIGT